MSISASAEHKRETETRQISDGSFRDATDIGLKEMWKKMFSFAIEFFFAFLFEQKK